MSIFSRTRLLALAVALAGAAAFGSAPAQAAQSATLSYMCKIPLTGTAPLQLDVVLDIPDSWPSEDLPPFAVTGTINFGSTTAQQVREVEGLAQIVGAAGSALRTQVLSPVGVPAAARIPLAFAPVAVGPLIPNVGVDMPFTGTFPSGVAPAVPGEHKVVLTGFDLNLKALRSDGTPVPGIRTPLTDLDAQPYPDLDGDPSTFNVPCKLDPQTQNPQLASFVAIIDDFDATPPTVPGQSPDYTGADITCNAIRLRWTPSTDEGPNASGVARYVVRWPEGPAGGATAPASATDVWIGNLGPDTEYTFEIVAQDQAGNESQPLTQTFRTLLPPPVAPGGPGTPCRGAAPIDPTPPGAPEPVSATQTSITFTWVPSQDFDGQILGYEVFRGDTLIGETATNTFTATGLTAGSAYTFHVVAIADDGQQIPGPSAELRTPTNPLPPPTIKYSYGLAGSTTLKTLTKGTLALKGAINAELTIASGAFTADLTLADTSGRLVAAGFLPVTAKIGFAPSGKTTGTLEDGVLKSQSKVRIKVKEVKLFGAIPLAGGNNCQTRQLSDINLQSTQAEFKPLEGGPIAGSYKISDLNGCGALNGLVSPLTAGGGNTINLNLAPVAAK